MKFPSPVGITDVCSNEWYEENARLRNDALSSFPIVRFKAPHPPIGRVYFDDICVSVDLIGATIDNVGMSPYEGEGGYTIDYTKNCVKKRIVFGYTELGIWVRWIGERNETSETHKAERDV